MIILLPITRLVLSSGLLFGYYYLFLRNRQFHRYNRFYLLLATVLALLSSFVSIPWHLAPPAQNGSGLVHTLQSISGGNWMEADTGEGLAGPARASWLTPVNGLLLLYLAGVATGLGVLLRSLFYIGRIRRKYPSWGIGNIRFYDTSEPGTPFSFFRLVFWNSDIPFNDRQGQQIFRHELYHVEQRHSLDVLWLELLCSIAWFNPFFHLLRKEMKVLHEFLADEYAASQNNRLDYAELLVTQALLLNKNRFSHPFAQTHIKRRIMMLTKSNHTRPGRPYLSRAMALPLLLLAISAFTLRPVYTAHGPLPRAATPVSVVIDAGHGGIDAGAQVEGIKEKDLTLALALKVNELAPQYNVRVTLTRNSDVLPGNNTNIKEGLKKRVEITEQEKPALFISLHVNVNGPGVSPNHAGFEAYIAGRNGVIKDEKSNQLASILLQQLHPLYTTAPKIIQRDSRSIWVLDHSVCPSVLLECGNLSFSEDVAFITNKNNQEKIARTILEGIVQYTK